MQEKERNTKLAKARKKLFGSLSRAVRSKKVFWAMEQVPRELFVPPESRHLAYEDIPLPIGYGQTISQPYIVAYTVQAMRLGASDRVLEVGTGSGYAAAVLAELCAEVFTIECIAPLAESAGERLARLGYGNVTVIEGDGGLGRPPDAPFDAITSTVIDDIAGVTTFNHTQGASTPQATIRVAKAAIRLTGCTTDVATLNDSFTSIQSTTGATVQEVAPSALTFRLGDAKSDGTVNIGDALFGAQYLASLRGIDTVGGDLALVNPVNMASVKDDGVAGDKINIADVLFIAQGLVGLRDACFTLLEVGTPPPGR